MDSADPPVDKNILSYIAIGLIFWSLIIDSIYLTVQVFALIKTKSLFVSLNEKSAHLRSNSSIIFLSIQQTIFSYSTIFEDYLLGVFFRM